jgi:putative dimethyl sulfoxide reductase chaperone
MHSPGERLRLLAMLLAAPEAESHGILAELAAEHPWLEVPAAELEQLGLAEWQAEHGRLFVCGHPRTPCVPFESAQLRGMMSGPELEQLAALYFSAGLEVDAVPPDYLGAMLECAAHLTQGQEHPEAERSLWHDHLLRWLPHYAATLQRESRVALYRCLGTELAFVCRDYG